MSYVTIERSQRKKISLGHSLKFKFLENEKKLKLRTILNTQNLKRVPISSQIGKLYCSQEVKCDCLWSHEALFFDMVVFTVHVLFHDHVGPNDWVLLRNDVVSLSVELYIYIKTCSFRWKSKVWNIVLFSFFAPQRAVIGLSVEEILGGRKDLCVTLVDIA